MSSGEREVVFVFELLDDEACHFRLGEGVIGEDAGVLRDAGVSLGLEGTEGFEEFPLVGGGFAFFEEPLVEAGVFLVVGVFGAKELVLPLQFAGAGVDVFEGGDVFAPFRPEVISERFFFLKRRSSSSFSVTKAGSPGSKLPARPSRVRRRFSRSSSAMIISASETFRKVKSTSSSGDVEDIDLSSAFSSASRWLSRVRWLFASVESWLSFRKSSFSRSSYWPDEADEVVEALGVIERFDDRAHFGAVYDLCDLLGEDFGVGRCRNGKGRP